MANPENEVHSDDANTYEQCDEQVEATQELRDLEPEKDVKGGTFLC